MTYPAIAPRADILATQAPQVRATDEWFIARAAICRPTRDVDLPPAWRCRRGHCDVHGRALRTADRRPHCNGDHRASQGRGMGLSARRGGGRCLDGRDGGCAWTRPASSPQQDCICRQLPCPPHFIHHPLLCNERQRLSKRDRSLDMAALRERYALEEIVGMLARAAGLQATDAPITAADLLPAFS